MAKITFSGADLLLQVKNVLKLTTCLLTHVVVYLSGPCGQAVHQADRGSGCKVRQLQERL